MIVIVDYGVGNVASVSNMIRRAGGEARLSSRPEDLLAASAIVLPGVGSFDHGMKQLRARGLPEIIMERISTGTPVLGVCLGMQLLALDSEEGTLPGLGVVRAHVRKFRFPPDRHFPVPHMGWNKVLSCRDNPLLPLEQKEQRFYFAHSYYLECDSEEDILCMSDYGIQFASGFAIGGVYGVQFHPEKSHRYGLELMTRFIRMANA